MAVRANRRWLCLLTALLFTIGSVAHVYAMTDAAMKMPTATMESGAPDLDADHGMDCGGGTDKASKTACVAMCATAVAILSEPVVVPVASTLSSVESDTQLPPPARGPSPEPHPPRR